MKYQQLTAAAQKQAFANFMAEEQYAAADLTFQEWERHFAEDWIYEADGSLVEKI